MLDILVTWWMLKKTLLGIIAGLIMEMMNPGNVFCPDSSFSCRMGKSQQRVAEPGLHNVLHRAQQQAGTKRSPEKTRVEEN